MQLSAAEVVCWPSRLETVNRETYLHLTDDATWDHKHDITEPESIVVIFDITDTNLVIHESEFNN